MTMLLKDFVTPLSDDSEYIYECLYVDFDTIGGRTPVKVKWDKRRCTSKIGITIVTKTQLENMYDILCLDILENVYRQGITTLIKENSTLHHYLIAEGILND